MSDEISDAIGAALGDGDRVSSWIARACEQRLEREGKLPGSERARKIAQLLDLTEALTVEQLDALARNAAQAA